MTEVAFHFNVPDRVQYACRLLRKAHQAQAKVNVVAPEADLLSLNQALWTFAPADFLPHCTWQAPEHVLKLSPIVLCPDSFLLQSPHNDVVVHWGSELPPEGFERHQRLIELVSHQEDDRQQARLRWKHYASRGYPIVKYDTKTSAK